MAWSLCSTLVILVGILTQGCGVSSDKTDAPQERNYDEIAAGLARLNDESILQKYPRKQKPRTFETSASLVLMTRHLLLDSAPDFARGFVTLSADSGAVSEMQFDGLRDPAIGGSVQADLRSFATPIKNQGQRPTCTAFSAVGALEFEVLRRFGLEFDLSEEQYWHRYGQGRWDAGLAFAAKDYLVPEAQWPYGKVFNQAEEPARIARITGAKALKAYSDTRAALGSRAHPVIFITEENETWGWNFQKETKGLIGFQNQSKQGAHALLAVGIVENPIAPGGGFFILKNSWGTEWGDAGFAYLPFAYCQRMGCSGFEVTEIEMFSQKK